MRWLPLIGLLPGCVAQPEADVVDRLTTTGGCGDVVIFARDEADTIRLKASVSEQLAQQAIDDGQPHQFYVQYPSTEIALTLEFGTNLSATTCIDVVVTEPKVRAVWVPRSGYATINVRPATRDDALPRADLVLDQVELVEQHGRGDPILLEAFRIRDVLVGWYAG